MKQIKIKLKENDEETKKLKELKAEKKIEKSLN